MKAIWGDEDDALAFDSFSGRFELLSAEISYRGERYPLSSVTHLGRFARRTSVNFIPVSTYLRIKIFLEGVARPITIQNTGGLKYETSPIKRIYEQLASQTFQQRANIYMERLNRNKFFEYGGARFFSSGHVSKGRWGTHLRVAKLRLEPFNLLVKERSVFSRTRRISTAIDQDVFLALIQQLYGVRF